MKATIKHTTHANLKPGDHVEVTGYCARVTATFDDATPHAKPKHEEREVFFGLGDLAIDFRTHAITWEQDAGPRSVFGIPEIPADLPKPPATPAHPAKPPTIAPQSAELGYLADILAVMRDIYEILQESGRERRGNERRRH